MHADSSYLRTIPEDKSDTSGAGAAPGFVLPPHTPTRSENSSVRADMRSVSEIASVRSVVPDKNQREVPQEEAAGSQSGMILWDRRTIKLSLAFFTLLLGVIVAIVIVAMRAAAEEEQIPGIRSRPPNVTVATTTSPTVTPTAAETGDGTTAKTTTAPNTRPPTPFPSLSPTTHTAGPTFLPTSPAPSTPQPTLDPAIVEELDSVLAQVTDPADFETPGTPQYMARQWMLYSDYLRTDVLDSGPQRILQRYALATLFVSMEALPAPQDDQPECYWDSGVICSDDEFFLIQ